MMIPRRLLHLSVALIMPHAASTLSVPAPAADAQRRPTDANMAATYDDLARRAIDAFRTNSYDGVGGNGRALWIGVIGGPGAGKSTLAGAVARRIGDLSSSTAGGGGGGEGGDGSERIEAVSIPMDGYHHSKSRLAELYPDDPTKGMSRRGSPWTFDPLALTIDLSEAKRTGRASLPEYDRKTSDPAPDAVKVEACHKIVLVEGNYLLLGALAAELDEGGAAPDLNSGSFAEACADLGCPHPIGDEIRLWKPVSSLFDETWFVAPPGGVEEQRRRLIDRSLETWTAAKTEAWGGGTDAEAAVRRADFNDVRNARLVECCRPYANAVVESI